MGQAIYFSLLNPWRLERSGREIQLIGNCFLTWRGKGG